MFNSYRVIGINSGFILFFKIPILKQNTFNKPYCETILQLTRVQSISNHISSLILTEIPQQAAWSQECTSAGVRSTANKSQPENRPTNKRNHEKGILLTHNRAVLNFIRVLKTKTTLILRKLNLKLSIFQLKRRFMSVQNKMSPVVNKLFL